MAIHVLTDVPPGELADVISDLRYQGFDANVTAQSNGLFTVTALPPAGNAPSVRTRPEETGSVASPANDSPPSASAIPSPSGEPVWLELVSAYRTYPDISDQLKIASLAQWILESGRGTSPLARQHLNFGGLKFRERMKGHADFVDYRGTDGEQTLYCKFDSVRAFIDGYWHFIASGPYGDWKRYGDDAAGYIRHIGPSYAGDPAYVGKVLRLFREARSVLGLPPADAAGGAAGAPDSGAALSTSKLAIVVGHNRIAKGAFGTSPIDKSEFEFNSLVASRMKDQAPHYNLVAEIFHREPSASYTQEIREAYRKVGQWRPACAIELHFNSSADPRAGGTEVLYRNGSSQGRALATNLVGSIQSLLRLPLRQGGTGLNALSPGQRGAGSVYALDDVVTVMVEPFFGSNAAETLRVATLGEEALALSYLRGVRDWTVARALAA